MYLFSVCICTYSSHPFQKLPLRSFFFFLCRIIIAKTTNQANRGDVLGAKYTCWYNKSQGWICASRNVNKAPSLERNCTFVVRHHAKFTLRHRIAGATHKHRCISPITTLLGKKTNDRSYLSAIIFYWELLWTTKYTLVFLFNTDTCLVCILIPDNNHGVVFTLFIFRSILCYRELRIQWSSTNHNLTL